LISHCAITCDILSGSIEIAHENSSKDPIFTGKGEDINLDKEQQYLYSGTKRHIHICFPSESLSKFVETGWQNLFVISQEFYDYVLNYECFYIKLSVQCFDEVLEINLNTYHIIGWPSEVTNLD
jgi:hypothetical protein